LYVGTEGDDLAFYVDDFMLDSISVALISKQTVLAMKQQDE
jgi:hypothetical protein